MQSISLFGKSLNLPIIFEESLDEVSHQVNLRKGTHLIVLVHGYLGSKYDLRMIQNIILLLYPKTDILVSESNQKNPECGIQVMGNNLAKEVLDYIENNSEIEKISFIGFSLGGVIIRAALPKLESYKEKMNTLMTLSSPHLGCFIQSGFLVSVGMWAMKKYKHSKCLNQLLMTDSKKYRNTFIYNLSKGAVFSKK